MSELMFLPDGTALSAEDMKLLANDYTEASRNDLFAWLEIIARVLGAPKKQPEMRVIAAENRHREGFDAKTIERRVYAFLRDGWRGVVNRSKAGPKHWRTVRTTALPEPFKEFAKAIFEENGRAIKPAYDELLKIWRTHCDSAGKYYADIPGYTAWPMSEAKTGLPKGWTYSNLCNVCRPSALEKAASRQGRHAAKAFALPVLKTRVGVAVGRIFEFDDHDFNHYVIHPLCAKPMRPMCFGQVDYTTNARVLLACKPAMWDDDEQKKKVLTEFDFAWFVVHSLCNVGYRTDAEGTTFMVENAKATIRGDKTRPIEDAARTDFEARIFRATCGKVRVVRGGIDRQPALLAQMEGEAKGNFRAKPLVEGGWYPLDTRLANLPGHVGKDYEHKREDTAAILRLNAQLLKACGGDMERYAALDGRLLWYDEFVAAVEEAGARILDATDHEMKGWEKCGFTTMDVETGEPRRMSRREAWIFGGGNELTKLSPLCVPMLLGAKYGRRVVVKSNNLIEFDDRRQDSDTIRFIATAREGRQLQAGAYWGFFNPFNDRGSMIVCDGPDTLRIVGVCPRYIAPAADKVTEVRKLMGESRRLLGEQLARMNRRHTGDAIQLAVGQISNAAVLSGLPRPTITGGARGKLTEEQRDAMRRTAGAGSLEDMLPEEEIGDRRLEMEDGAEKEAGLEEFLPAEPAE